jgi:hypothetical protein
VRHEDLEEKAENLNTTIFDSHFRLGVDAVNADDEATKKGPLNPDRKIIV